MSVSAPNFFDSLTKSKDVACEASRASAERECYYEFMLCENVDSYEVRKGIADTILEKYNSSGGCPDGGTYTAGFIQSIPSGEGTSSKIMTDKPYQGYQVVVSCSEHWKTSWSKGDTYEKGDIVAIKDTSNGTGDTLLFRCLRTHRSGSRSNTRNPFVKSNKGSWEVIGTPDGNPPTYVAVARFSPGFVVKYNGNLYSRTAFNLTGGQTPYSKSSSRYWLLIGPAEE